MGSSDDKGNFKRYLEAYRKSKGLSVEDALKHKIVQDIKAYYETDDQTVLQK